MNKIYWVENENGGQMGSWPTKKEAEEFIESGFLPKDVKYTVIGKDTTTCPTCGRFAEKDIVDGLGECLSCDHVRGDVMIEERYAREELDDYEE